MTARSDSDILYCEGIHCIFGMGPHIPGSILEYIRQRGDSNPCGQSPMDFESISLTTRTHCLRGRQASPAPSSFSRKRQQEKWNLYPGDHAALSPLALSRKPEGVRNKVYSSVTASLDATQSPQWGSNPRPYAYEAYALPTEL